MLFVRTSLVNILDHMVSSGPNCTETSTSLTHFFPIVPVCYNHILFCSSRKVACLSLRHAPIRAQNFAFVLVAY